MNLLVTGGAGFIGSNLADALIAEGHNVTIIDDLSTGRKENIPENDIKSIYWEAGGQEGYRTEYLNNPEKFLAGYERIIFVIDIQDIPRYDEALTYLDDILKKLSELNIVCKIDLYMHKYDPNIDKSDKYSEENLNQNLTFKIRPIVPPQFKLRIYKTSLFTVFRRSLVD